MGATVQNQVWLSFVLGLGQELQYEPRLAATHVEVVGFGETAVRSQVGRCLYGGSELLEEALAR